MIKIKNNTDSSDYEQKKNDSTLTMCSSTKKKYGFCKHSKLNLFISDKDDQWNIKFFDASQ